MEDILKYVGAGAGYPPLVVGIVLLWRLLLRYGREMEFWRDKYLAMRDEIAEPATRTVERIVRTPPRDDEDKAALRTILQSVLGKEERPS